jgi:hypothetical protein
MCRLSTEPGVRRSLPVLSDREKLPLSPMRGLPTALSFIRLWPRDRNDPVGKHQSLVG